MINFKTFITESFDAHLECAQANVPLPDKELTNLRKFHNGWIYDSAHGKVEHNTTAHGSREPGAGYVVHYHGNKIHRENGLPAIEHSDGSQIWFNHGTRVGTYVAKSKNNNKEQYWDDGKQIARDDFAKKFKGLNERHD